MYRWQFSLNININGKKIKNLIINKLRFLRIKMVLACRTHMDISKLNRKHCIYFSNLKLKAKRDYGSGIGEEALASEEDSVLVPIFLTSGRHSILLRQMENLRG